MLSGESSHTKDGEVYWQSYLCSVAGLKGAKHMCGVILVFVKRQFADIKLCKVKIKLIALGWYLVTMIFWCQTNPEIHCSPAMHIVQDKTKNILKWPSERVKKISLFWLIYGAVFLDNLCLYLYFSQNQTLSPFLSNISDIVAILPPRYCKSLLASACTLEGRIIFFKKSTVKLVTSKRKHCCVS